MENLCTRPNIGPAVAGPVATALYLVYVKGAKYTFSVIIIDRYKFIRVHGSLNILFLLSYAFLYIIHVLCRQFR